MPDKRYTKVEEEIIQILDKLEDERPARPRPSHLKLVKPQQQRRRFNVQRLLVVSPLLPLVGAFVLAFLALTFSDESALLATTLAVASIILFLSPLAMRRGEASDDGAFETKRWRDRDVSLSPPPGPSPLDRARRWMEDRRRPR